MVINRLCSGLAVGRPALSGTAGGRASQKLRRRGSYRRGHGEGSEGAEKGESEGLWEPLMNADEG